MKERPINATLDLTALLNATVQRYFLIISNNSSSSLIVCSKSGLSIARLFELIVAFARKVTNNNISPKQIDLNSIESQAINAAPYNTTSIIGTTGIILSSLFI